MKLLLSLFQFVPKPLVYQDGYDGLIDLTSTQNFGTLFYSTKTFLLDAHYYQPKYDKTCGLRDSIQSKHDIYFAIEPNLELGFV